MMTVDVFFDLFLAELKENKNLWSYYKFLTDPNRLSFRKAYFCQRLQYIIDHIGPKEQQVWDCGCGYGTTALFLALNGYRVHGSTLEFYYREIEGRKKYWSQYGDTSLFACVYEDLHSSRYAAAFDTIILQDTLHHLEPVGKALQILNRSLKPNGRLVVVEENGCNLVQNLKLLRQRGFNKKVESWDEQLNKKVVFADENIRCLKTWTRVLQTEHFSLDLSSVQYIRFFPPYFFRRQSYQSAIRKEARIAHRYRALARLFFFGINFIAVKADA